MYDEEGIEYPPSEGNRTESEHSMDQARTKAGGQQLQIKQIKIGKPK